MQFNKFLLPNSLYTGILPLGLDLIAALFGIEKHERELKFFKDARVNKANRYMMKQYKRLAEAAKKGDMELYENIAKRILTKSLVYRYIAMHRVENGWFWELKAAKIRMTMKKLGKICEEQRGNIEYIRTWIPKGDDKYGRPLGAPTLEWRFWGWMNLNLMEIWCHYQGLKPTWQHGGLSGRGVTSAWSELITKHLESENIIEFDIKGFFNQITHESILRFVEESGLKFWKTQIENNLKSVPKRTNNPPLEEERDDLKLKTMLFNILNYMRDKRVKEERDTKKVRNHAYGLDIPGRGTPQGYNTSPFLCVMTLGRVLKEIPGIVMYMDDGVITAPTRDKLYERYEAFKEALKSVGLVVAPNKTHVVKEQGRWLRDLKFIGLRYKHETDMIWSETRSGTVIQFPKAEWRDNLENHLWRGHSPGAVREILSIAAHKAAAKYGLLGLLTNHVFAPGMKTTERELIEIGLNKAYLGMKTNKKTFIADNRTVLSMIEDERTLLVTSASTRMMRVVLEKGFIVHKGPAKSSRRTRKIVK
jgi:hypothetical protein